MKSFLTFLSLAFVLVTVMSVQAGTSCGCGKSRAALEQAQ